MRYWVMSKIQLALMYYIMVSIIHQSYDIFMFVLFDDNYSTMTTTTILILHRLCHYRISTNASLFARLFGLAGSSGLASLFGLATMVLLALRM